MPRLTETVTQAAADGYAEADVATALEGQTRQAYRILELQFEFILPAVSAFPYPSAANQDLELCLSRRTKAAMPNISDIDVIKKWRWSAAIMTAAGVISAFDNAAIWIPPGDVLIVEDPLYLQIDSTSTSQVWSAILNITYEVVSITEVARLTLLTQSLT